MKENSQVIGDSPRVRGQSPITPKDAGFSLIEVVMAITILSIAILALNSMQTFVIKGNASSRGVAMSTAWAMDRLERFQSLSYSDATLTDANGNGSAGLTANTVATADGNEMAADGTSTVLWNVADNMPLTDTKTVVVYIQYLEGGVQKELVFRYVKSRDV